jgi:hypothetical protein
LSDTNDRFGGGEIEITTIYVEQQQPTRTTIRKNTVRKPLNLKNMRNKPSAAVSRNITTPANIVLTIATLCPTIANTIMSIITIIIWREQI